MTLLRSCHALLAASTFAACAAPVPPTADASRPPLRVSAELEWIAPAAGSVVREPRASVSGRVHVLRDFVVLIDRSGSTKLASGMDVDGDGEIGRKSFTRLTSDADDNVLFAEVRAARALLARLDPASSRASVLVFSLHTETLASLSSPAAASEALAAWAPMHASPRDCHSYSARGVKRQRIRIGAPLDVDPNTILCEGGTSIGQALHDAVLQVRHRARGDAARLPTFVVFSDGEATAPDPDTAWKHARKAALYLASHGVVVHLVDYGASGRSAHRDAMREVARITGGDVLTADDPALEARLAELGRVAVEKISLSNRSAGSSGDLALTGDAAQEFSGEIALAPGDNLLALDFELVGGLGFSRELTVRYEPAAP